MRLISFAAFCITSIKGCRQGDEILLSEYQLWIQDISQDSLEINATPSKVERGL